MLRLGDLSLWAGQWPCQPAPCFFARVFVRIKCRVWAIVVIDNHSLKICHSEILAPMDFSIGANSGANTRGLRTEPSPQDQCRHHVFCPQASWIVIVELSQFFLASCRSGACKFQPWAAGEPCRFHQRRARCLEYSQIVYCE